MTTQPLSTTKPFSLGVAARVVLLAQLAATAAAPLSAQATAGPTTAVGLLMPAVLGQYAPAGGATDPVFRLPPVVAEAPTAAREPLPTGGFWQEEFPLAPPATPPPGGPLPAASEPPGESLEGPYADDLGLGGIGPLAGDEAVVDEGPLVVYHWYDVRTWLPDDQWEASFELGLNGTTGNSESFSQRAGANAKWTIGPHAWRSEIIYNAAATGGTETANNALATTRYERNLGESPWSLFVAGTLEYDEFRNFDLRLAANTGLGYAFIQNEATTLKGRFGSGVSHEIGGPDDRYVPEAVLGGDFEHQLTARQKLSLVSDYYPEWGDFENYRLITNAGWEIVLDEAMNLSLKLAANHRYDSTPEGDKPSDLAYSLLLLWKL